VLDEMPPVFLLGVIGGIFFLSKKKKIPPDWLKAC